MKSERLKKYWLYKGCKKPADFARLIGGIAASNISEIDKRKNNTKLLLQIKNTPECSDLNLEWLETGVGEMIIPVVADSDIDKSFVLATRLREDQKDILRLWEEIDEDDRNTVKSVLERFAVK